jgi:endonuclease/exonuclease/phosphatase family metal-dependent hydrolase
MLKVLTYNIHKGFSQYNRSFVLHEIKQQLENTDVDIVFLQEIHGQHQKHQTQIDSWPQASQFEFLSDQIWPHYAYGKNAIYDHGHHGNAILSKHKFIHWDNINLSRFRRASRSLLHGIIRIDDNHSPLHLICIHLELLGFERSRQLNILKEYISKSIPESDAIIIAGDFNDATSRTGRRLESQLDMHEAFRTKFHQYAKTFPSHLPLLRMDRIYFRQLQLLDCERLSGKPWNSLSDHLPLSASFSW